MKCTDGNLLVTTAIVFFPLMLAIDMLTEAALSFLSIGVQPPDASWGTIILDGQGLLYTRPVVAIAPGIAIAITVLALPHPKATVLLSIIWSGAVLGILFRVFFIRAPRWLYVPLYVALGFGSFAYIVDFYNANATMMTLILVGGLFYTIGAVVYGLKRPNPFPGRFGFHEIFHTLTLFAFLSHWVGILVVATNPPQL